MAIQLVFHSSSQLQHYKYNIIPLFKDSNMALIPQRRALLALQNDLTQFGGHVHTLTGTVVAGGQAYLAVEHNVNGLWNA